VRRHSLHNAGRIWGAGAFDRLLSRRLNLPHRDKGFTTRGRLHGSYKVASHPYFEYVTNGASTQGRLNKVRIGFRGANYYRRAWVELHQFQGDLYAIEYRYLQVEDHDVWALMPNAFEGRFTILGHAYDLEVQP